MKQQRWFDRVFELGKSIASAPEIVDRLRTAPERLVEIVETIPTDVASTRLGDSWSIAEHVGHLSDLEPLWFGRLEELLAGFEELRPADLENTATWSAGHNDKPMAELIQEFEQRRGHLVSRLEGLSADELSSSALHPRLRQPMSVVDLGFFVAEHDDHHLATIKTLAGTSDR